MVKACDQYLLQAMGVDSQPDSQDRACTRIRGKRQTPIHAQIPAAGKIPLHLRNITVSPLLSKKKISDRCCKHKGASPHLGGRSGLVQIGGKRQEVRKMPALGRGRSGAQLIILALVCSHSNTSVQRNPSLHYKLTFLD